MYFRHETIRMDFIGSIQLDEGHRMTVTALPHVQRGSGAPLVVFPGLSGRTGTPKLLERWLEGREIGELSSSRAVWRIHRRIGLEQGISVADLAAEYAEALRNLFDEPVDVVGVSTGGSIALQLAADHPELVKRLVLVSAAYRLSDEGRETQRRVAALLREGRPRRAASVFLGATGATAAGRAMLTVVGLLIPRVVVGRNDLDLLVTLDAEDSFDLAPRLAAIETPTLVTGGGLDRFYSREMFEGTRAGMPRARLELSPRRGHMSAFGNRAAGRRILRFLDGAEESQA